MHVLFKTCTRYGSGTDGPRGQVDRKSPKRLLRKRMAFWAKIAVSSKGGPLGKMAVLADFEDLEGAGAQC
eukprot:SAG31_NODE_1454_length_8278_cov_7.030688_5_plen_70_part_00